MLPLLCPPFVASWDVPSEASTIAPALATPSLVADVPQDAPTARVLPLRVEGPASWPAGVRVTIETRRGAAAWVPRTPTLADGGTLALSLPREAVGYAARVRAIARDPSATLVDSEYSGELTLAVPALDVPVAPPPAPTSVPTTVRWTLRASPLVLPASGRLALLARGRNWLEVRDVVDDRADRYVVLDTLRWQLTDPQGDPVLAGAFTRDLATGTWSAELMLDAQPDLDTVVSLLVTGALDGATWPYRYPVTLREVLG
jgi:hypothetical protein